MHTESDTTQSTHRFIEAGGLTWHVVDTGAGASTIVLAAGFPQTWYAWRRVIPLLAATHRVIVVDLPGQGDSGESPVGYETWDVAGLLHDLLDELDLGPVVLAGHDVGAWVAYAAAYRYPARLRGVALLDGNIAGVNLELDAGTSWGGWHFVFNRVPDLPEALITGRERILLEWFFSRSALDCAATFTTEDLDEYERALARPGSLRGMLGYYRAVPANTTKNLELQQAPLTVPVLAVVGATSGSKDLPDRLRSHVPDLRATVLDGSKHYLPEEQPDEVAHALSGFVAAVDR